MADKVFRDPLYNYICIERPRDRWLIDLLNTPEVQRLRRIHQLGVSDFTYPGATHTRLAHSLGVVHLMQHVLGHLEKTHPDQKIHNCRMRLLAAALLHDVGHGPFSHLFEPCLHVKHEKWSIAVLLDQNSGPHRVLAKEDRYLPQQVADLIDEENTAPAPWQKALLSSQLDVDRLDYLRRDSLFTGAGYGHFDYFRLLTTVEFLPDNSDIVWPAKSANAIEEYIFARYYMYQNVYLHKTTRGFELLLQAMWRPADFLRAGNVDLGALPALAEFWKIQNPSPDTMPLATYLGIEEPIVLAQVAAWRTHEDAALADLARRFLCRDGLAMIEPPPLENPLVQDYSAWENALREIVAKAGFKEPAAYCLQDKIAGKYMQPYRPEKEPDNQSSTNSIRVQVEGGQEPVEIAEYLARLKAVTETPVDKVRYYVPKELRAEAKKLRQEWKVTPAQQPAAKVLAASSGSPSPVQP